MSHYNGKERREDRKEARHQKHEDIKNGESRKDAREDKHAMKKADRQKWGDEGHGITDDINTWASDVADDTLNLVAEIAGPAVIPLLATEPEENNNG